MKNTLGDVCGMVCVWGRLSDSPPVGNAAYGRTDMPMPCLWQIYCVMSAAWYAYAEDSQMVHQLVMVCMDVLMC
jgi:hypothetical protein